jgi:hypothetical protein
METKTAQGSSMMLYRYETVKITKPEPIKEMPGLGSSAPSGAGQMPSQEELEKMMQEYSLDR